MEIKTEEHFSAVGYDCFSPNDTGHVQRLHLFKKIYLKGSLCVEHLEYLHLEDDSYLAQGKYRRSV